MSKILLAIVTSFFVSGCAFVGQSDQVLVNDGINKQEAKVIAQKELARAGQDKVFAVSKPAAQDDGANWKVVFPVSSPNIFSHKYFSYYVVELDKSSGKIARSETTEALSDLFEE
ncbi:MAG: hypothetical protein AABZ46_00265 [Nitrospirota bacterium]